MNKLKNIVECLVIAAIVLFGGLFLGRFLNPDWTDGAANAIKAFHALPENSVDVIAYGSSHTLKGIDPSVLKEKYGINAYNYGGNWQALNTSFLFFQDSIRTQKPKVILFETYQVANILSDVNMDGQIYYTKGIPMFQGKYDYLKQCFGSKLERWISYYFPISMFHSSWNEIDSENFSKGTPVKTYYSNMGFVGSSQTVDVTIEDYKEFEQFPLPEKSVELLDRLINVCKENDIHIIFYTVPYEGKYRYYDAMEEYARANGCTYINFFEKFEEAGFDPAQDFQDVGHLNTSGSRKVADYLGAYIQNYLNG